MLRRSCRLALALAGVLAASEARAQSGVWPRVYIRDVRTASAVRMALDGAARRFSHERCQTLLSEFHDQQGRPLSVRMGELASTERDYLELLVFVDGTDAKGCRESTLAFTAPGHRVVFVCARGFERARAQNIPLADAIVIHEMLHTLGLGENPPSSYAITHRVLGQCNKG